MLDCPTHMPSVDGSNAKNLRVSYGIEANGLRFIYNNYRLDVYHKYYWYVLTGGDLEVAEETMLSIVKLDACLGTIVKCLIERKARERKQWEYVDFFAVPLPHVSNKIVGEVGDLAMQRDGEELGSYEDEVNVDDDRGDRFPNS